jgi:hypothetical protein
MSSIALSAKAAKLMALRRRRVQLYRRPAGASITDSVCRAICMTEGCDYTTEMDPTERKAVDLREELTRVFH